MLKEEVTMRSDDAMSENYYRDGVVPVIEAGKNVWYGHKELSIVLEEDMNVM